MHTCGGAERRRHILNIADQACRGLSAVRVFAGDICLPGAFKVFGFGPIGGAMRRKRQQTVRYSFGCNH